MAQSKSKATKEKAVAKKKTAVKSKASAAKSKALAATSKASTKKSKAPTKKSKAPTKKSKAPTKKSKAPTKRSEAPTKKKVVPKGKGIAKKSTAPAKKVPTPSTSAKPAVPPRLKPTSKRSKLQFKAGDYVVYPTHGVGLVQGIEKEVIAGHKLELVVVTFDNDRMTLRVPMEKMDTSGLRELSNRKTMDNAMTTLKGRARIKRTMWSRRAQEYEAKINSGDPISIAEVVRDLHRNVGQPDQSFSERQIYESALERLAGEVAAVDGTDKAKAVEKLEQTLKFSG